MSIIPAILQRRSIRRYQDKPVEDAKLEAILRAAMYAPSAHHYRHWEFIIIKDKQIIEELSKTKRYAEHLAHAPLIIAICSQDWRYWVEDASIVAAHIYLEATNQNLGTCWTQIRGSKTHDLADAEIHVKKLLNVPAEMRVLCLMPIGYPAEDLKEHRNNEFNAKKIHYEQYSK